MSTHSRRAQAIRCLGCLLALSSSLAAVAQDRFPTMPRYDRYDRLRNQIYGSVKRGDLRVRWADDGKAFYYTKDAKTYKYDLAARKSVESQEPPVKSTQTRGRRNRNGPARGRQFDTTFSPDGKLKAVSRDRNVYLSDADGKNEIAVTTEASAEKRTKFGIASWVYGEELEVREAMWFSPDNAKLAFYRFDESKVPDYFLAMNSLDIQDKLDVEAYPKAGAPNPEVSLLVYDLASKATVPVDVKFDSGGGADLGQYVYDVRWSPNGAELLFNRTNRHQNVMEFCAANPATGKCLVIIREAWPKSWTENHPGITYLADNNRFLWMSERNGWQNIYLYDLGGKLIRPVTEHTGFEVSSIVRVDEKGGKLYYLARDGNNPYLQQLHRVGLDGKGDVRLTDPGFSHTVDVSPDGKFVLDVAERLDMPPVTRLIDGKGKLIDELATSDTTKFDQLGLKKPERLTFTAADGKTKLYGWLSFPSDFDPAKKYPLIVGVYGGPESSGGAERFQVPDPITEMGFLVAWFDGRGTSGRGKAFKDEVYGKLGVVEIDDQAAGVRALRERPYVDGSRVGIQGTSYGGYASCMAILRHPDVFQAAAASSPVTDWRNYDSIYTERFDNLPQDNKDGYDAGSAMTYAKNLKGRLLLYYGTADNNVHPSNTFQLVRALAQAGKSFDMMVGPDQGHSGVNSDRMWEFFIDNLILKHPPDSLSLAYKEYKRQRRSKA